MFVMFKKNENFQQKMFDILLIFAQNIDRGYTLEPPRLKYMYLFVYRLVTLRCTVSRQGSVP